MIDHNDPRLTAYVLGELDETARQEVRTAIEASPALQQAVRNIRDTAGMLETEFAAELNGAGPVGRVSLADKTETITKRSSGGRRMAWIVVASLLIAATGTSLWILQPNRDGVALRGGIETENDRSKSLLMDLTNSTIEQDSWNETGDGDGKVEPYAANLSSLTTESSQSQSGSTRDSSEQSKLPSAHYMADDVQHFPTGVPADGGTVLLGGIKGEIKTGAGGKMQMMTTPRVIIQAEEESPVVPGRLFGSNSTQYLSGQDPVTDVEANHIASSLNGVYGDKLTIAGASEKGQQQSRGKEGSKNNESAAGQGQMMRAMQQTMRGGGNGDSKGESLSQLGPRVDPTGTKEITLPGEDVNENARLRAEAVQRLQAFMGGNGRGENLAGMGGGLGGGMGDEREYRRKEIERMIQLDRMGSSSGKQVEEAIRDFEGRYGKFESASGDRYESITENDFLRPSDSPLSTFSIDVDTASYSKVRMYLKNYRQLPPPGAVRIEELVNYFGYNYAPPTGDAPFAAHQSVSACPWNPQHKLVRVAIKGREIEQDKRPVSNLVFLLDVSGSMNETNKLPLVKRGIQMLIDQLSENDRVAMVVYAGAAGKVLDSTTGDKKDVIRGALDRLQAGGSTNGGDGIRLAYQIVLDNFITGGVNRVILCTDGDFNVGTTSNDELVKLVEEKAKNNIFLSVLGFGQGNLNDSMLEQISNKGNGNYSFIDTDVEAHKVLVEQMTGTLITIAKDVKIQVEFNPARVAAYRLVGYENRVMAAQDFNDDKKDAGEIGAGHTVTAIYEVVPPEAWKAEQTVEIALAGLFDLNFDGVDDRDRLIEKIESSGGIVVAWIDDEGAVQGSIPVTTRYFVTGDMPKGDSDTNKKAIQSIRQLKADADKNNVRQIVTVQLMQWLGMSTANVPAQPPVDDLKYQTVPEAKAVEDTGELLTLKLRYKQPEGDVSQLLTFPLMDKDNPFVESDRDFQFSAAVASFGMLLRGSKYAGQSSYDSVLEIAESAAKGDESGYRIEFLEMVRIARELAGSREK